jgi:hypothetical protein
VSEAPPFYNFGALYNITDVHFGANWLAIGIDLGGLGIASPTVTVSLPGSAGGTPGVKMYPNNFAKWPRQVTKNDLANTLNFGAGLSLGGFGVSQIGAIGELDGPKPATGINVSIYSPTISHKPPPGGHEMYLDTSSLGPGSFSLRITWTGVPSNFGQPLDLVYFPTKDTIKVGASLPPPPTVHDKGFFSPAGPTVFTHDYTIDPKKRTVVTS